MKLYDAGFAPNPRKVRLYLAEKGISVDRVVLDMRVYAHLAPEYLSINPLGTVPALLLDDGTVLTESVAICRYFEASNPAPPLFGTTPIEIALIECWTRRIEGEGYAAAVYALRDAHPAFKDRALPGAWPPVPQIAALVDRAQNMWDRFVESLDARLGQALWIAGPVFTFADITALVTIDFARSGRLAIPEGAVNLRRWHAAASDRPSAAA